MPAELPFWLIASFGGVIDGEKNNNQLSERLQL
jgi:hypothetical protein